MDFYTKTGKLALGSRLRRLGQKLLEDGVKIYGLYEVDLDPKWFPIFYSLSQEDTLSITEIAAKIGQSHPSVSQMVKEMKKEGVIKMQKSETDGRVNHVSLTEKGKTISLKMNTQLIDVKDATEELLGESHHSLWKAIEDMEFLLSKENFYKRVIKKRKERESKLVEIVDYDPKYKLIFRDLNHEWITKYFQLEHADNQTLDHPETKIIKPGGYICFARYNDEIVGTCALVKMDNDTYELAKMAVSQKARGKNIGWLIGQHIIQKAKNLGAKKVYLESNTRLEPAINLYYKLGFKRVVGPPSPYERANIQMELEL